MLRNDDKDRIFDIVSFVIDFLLAGVAIATFQNRVLTCCGLTPFDSTLEDIDSAADDPDEIKDWGRRIRIAIFSYPALLILESYPVLVKRIPLNVINPIIGYFITIATFFDSGRTEALILWGMEAASLLIEHISRQIEKLKLERGPQEDETEEIDPKKEERLETVITFLNLSIMFSFLVMVAIITISEKGGVCVTNNEWNILFPPDEEETGNKTCGQCTGKEFCEICFANGTQCFIPYNF